MILPLLLQPLFGLSLPLHKVALHNCSPLLFAGLRMLLGGLMCMLISWWRTPDQFFRMESKFFTRIGMVMLWCVGMKYVLKYHALSHLPVVYTAAISGAAPLCIGIFSCVLHKKRFAWQQWGIMLAVAGTVLCFVLAKNMSELSWGCAVMMIASLCAGSYSTLLLSDLSRVMRVPLLLMSGIYLCLAGVVTLCISGISEPWHGTVSWHGFFVFGILVVLTAINHWAYLFLLRNYSLISVSIADVFGPLCAAWYGWLLCGESVSGHALCAVGIIAVVALFFRR